MITTFLSLAFFSSGESLRSDDRLLPFVPFPTNPSSGLPVESPVTQADHSGDIKLNAPIQDPQTGLQCPIVAITIHPQSGVAYPVAGTHTDPVTGLPVPIEIGSVMIDPDSEQPVVIVDVTIDPDSGMKLSSFQSSNEIQNWISKTS